MVRDEVLRVTLETLNRQDDRNGSSGTKTHRRLDARCAIC
jgi:hypothetical protein